MSFEVFFQAMGFEEYPFAIFSAEGERRRLEALFVKPLIYTPLVETFGNRSTVIVAGERGTGKTALIYELIRVADKKSLNVYIEDFSELKIGYGQDDLYHFLISHLAEELLKRLASKRLIVAKLSKDDRLLLSYILKFHIDSLSLSRLEERIRKIQIGLIKRFGFSIYNILRGVLNYGASAAINVTSDVVRRHFPGLPPIDESQAREYFPALRRETVDPLQKAKANFSLLEKVSRLALTCGFDRVVFILDKIDEEQRLENDAGEIASFLETMLCDNKLLLHGNVQFLIACWSIPLDQLRSKVRFQKLSVQRVSWDSGELLRVLNQRLSIFSNDKTRSIEAILSEDAMPDFNQALALANGNPRDLWHLMDAILKRQYQIDPLTSKISKEAITRGAASFVSDFNFYEYYPKNAKARADSMDVYSYIAHLLKLQTYRFTKSQLKDQAGTGGSTNNYVVAMENIGLVSKTDAKSDSGGVIYEIRDPKVVFAKDNGISITR